MSLKPQPVLSCDECKEIFPTKGKLNLHMKLHLPSTSGETTKKKKAASQLQKKSNSLVTLTSVSSACSTGATIEVPQAMNLSMPAATPVSILATNNSIEIIPIVTPKPSQASAATNLPISNDKVTPAIAVSLVKEPSLTALTSTEKDVKPIYPTRATESTVTALPDSGCQVALPKTFPVNVTRVPETATFSINMQITLPLNTDKDTNSVYSTANETSVTVSQVPVSTTCPIRISPIPKPAPISVNKEVVLPVSKESQAILPISVTNVVPNPAAPVIFDKVPPTFSKSISQVPTPTMPTTNRDVILPAGKESQLILPISRDSVPKPPVKVSVTNSVFPVTLLPSKPGTPLNTFKTSNKTNPVTGGTTKAVVKVNINNSPSPVVSLVKVPTPKTPVPPRMVNPLIPVGLVKSASSPVNHSAQSATVVPVCLSKAVSIIPINTPNESLAKAYYNAPNGNPPNTISPSGLVPMNLAGTPNARLSKPKKTYKCGQCNKDFTSSSNLKRHEASCKIVKEMQGANPEKLEINSEPLSDVSDYSDDDGRLDDIEADDLSGDEDFSPKKTVDKFQESLRWQMKGKGIKRSNSLMTYLKPKMPKIMSKEAKEPKRVKKAKAPFDPKLPGNASEPKSPGKIVDLGAPILPATDFNNAVKTEKPVRPKKDRVKKVKLLHTIVHRTPESAAELAAMQLLEIGNKEEELECHHCGHHSADRVSFLAHLGTHTGNLLTPVPISHTCNMCNKSFTRKYHLDRHLMMTACSGQPPPAHMCQVCSKVYTRKDNLREHLRAHAGDILRRKKYKCEFCEKHFHGLSLLKIHERLHTGEKPFQCDFCSKAFPSTGALTKHRRIHTGEKPYVCGDCGIGFALKGTLNRHTRIHTGVRPHKCQYCGKEFIQAGGLKAHLFFHTGENGFKCDECSKSFNRKSRLQMHMRYVHEKVKPHECENCGKAFTRKEDLFRHTVLHTGEKPFVCPTCNKCFAIKPSLKLHLLTHTKEEPRSCHECGRAFIRKDCLLRHMRKRHRDLLDKILADESEEKVHDDEGQGSVRIFTEQTICASIKELLSLLVDETTLKGFGWPDKPVDELLEAVIRRCGHTPVNPDEYSYIDRLRENSKLLFTVVIDDNAVKTLLNNQTVDEVILHVLRLAKS